MSLRRAPLAGLAVGVTTAVAVSLLAGPSVQAAPTAEAYDPDGVVTGAAWLESQLTDDLLVGEFGPNYGPTIDVALAYDAVDTRPARVQSISDAIAANIGSYISSTEFDPGSTYANATAKALVMAQVSGDDATAYGGENLVTRLEGRVAETGPGAGRISDQSAFGDFANTIGQGFAARGLARAGSTDTPAVLDYLLLQQCDEGYFSLSLSQAGTTCELNPNGSPSVDTTALTVLALQALPAAAVDADVTAAITEATDWLAGVQLAGGGFTADGAAGTANANSTGLAGWVLGDRGRTAPAESAAVWVRSHQLVNTADCTPFAAADEGAILFDDAALAAVGSAALTDAERTRSRLAAGQALPALQWAPDGVTARSDVIRGNVRPGTRQTFTVTASPGDVVCASRGGNGQVKRVPADGRVTFAVRMPKGTSDQQVRVTDGDELVGVQAYYVRGVKRFSVQVPATVGRGDRAVIVVTGMAPGEEATIRVRGARLDKTNANARGQLRYGFRPGGKLGKVQVRVTGAFAQTRFGTDTFRLTR